MLKKTLTMSALTGALVFASGFALAADQDRTRPKDQDQTKSKAQDQDRNQNRVFGSQLMTRQERNEYRNRMRTAKTAEEREQIRAEHHERMKVRAKERGVTLPDDPPARGMGPGGAMSPGGGMGPGGGSERGGY